MKFSYWKLTTIILALLLLPACYLLSPLSERTNTPQVLLEREGRGYRAIVVNRGYLPVFVGRCETVSDVMDRDVRVGDAIQRWESESNWWQTPLYRNHCRLVGTGVIRAEFRRKLLWPGQRLHTSAFFPNVGFPGFPFQHGDKLRFLVFTGVPEQSSQALNGPEFTIE